MAEEGDDVQGNVQEERSKILVLQSEQFRKHEQLARLKNKREALRDELSTRETEFASLMTEFHTEQKREEAKKQGQDKAKVLAAATAEGEFIKQEVRKLLQERVPVMANILEEGDDANVGLDGEVQKQEQSSVHNTVLINYVQLQDNAKKYKTLQVTYRIDTQTRPLQLLKDACAYWGCSQKDHYLCKKENHTAEVKKIEEEPLTTILKTHQDSVLWLVNNKDEKSWKKLLDDDEKKRKSQAAQQQAERTEPDDQTSGTGGWVQTMMFQIGAIFMGEQKKEQTKDEDFFNAFRPWPGIYHLLKDRSRSREDSVKWQNVPFSDWVIFSVLILVSCIIIAFQNETDYFELKAGVEKSLIAGLPGQNYRMAEPRTYLFDTFVSPGPGLLWTEATEGVSWAAGTLRLDGANQSIRTRKALPLNSRKVEVKTELPVGVNCSEYYVAFGSQADLLRFSWDCNRLEISAPGSVSSSAARHCSNRDPYSIMITIDMEGKLSFRDESGCKNDTVVTLQHDLQSVVRPLYISMGASGTGIFNSIMVTTRDAEPVMHFRDIRRPDELWNWLGGPFIYQLFDKESPLRRNYVPVGYMRIRQQKVKQKDCSRDNIPSNLAKPCHYVSVDKASRDENEIPQVVGWAFSKFLQMGGTDPRIWQGPRPDIESPYGLIQHVYDSSGYAADYHLTVENLGSSGAQQFSRDLVNFRSYWVSTSTRMIAVDLILADHNLGGYVNVRLLFEISASGAIWPNYFLLPFHISLTDGEKIADGVNAFRWSMIIICLLFFRVYREGKRKFELGKSGLHYIISFNGILDQCVIGLFFAIQYMRLKERPPNPYELTRFYSYDRAADNKAQLRVAEAAFLCLLFGRWATLMRLFPMIFRFFKTFSKSMVLFLYFLAMFLPVFLGNIFCANAIWQPSVKQLSTWTSCIYVFFLSLQESFEVAKLEETSQEWSLAFLTWFFVSIRIFFVHMFLAITVHCYFEVDLIEGIRDEDVKWDKAQWLDWLLWPELFEKLGMGQSGISRNKGAQQGGSQEDDDDSDDDDDAEGKRE